jgi:hypothetical protein
VSAEISRIYLLDAATGGAVEAELRDAIEAENLNDWQTKWQPALLGVLRGLARKGVPQAQWPQSWHWNWQEKTARVSGLLAYKGFSIVALGETQGLAQIDLTKCARILGEAGKPIVYIDYLEAAPWNRPELGGSARLRGVGTALITAAVFLSLEEGFKGRIGLHSLPQADTFYRDRCGMTDLGPDPDCQNLRYFEFTPGQAGTFLEE